MKIDFKLEGMKDLEEAFAELEKPAQRKASARRALKKAARPIADTAQQLAPRDKGFLRESITIGTKLSRRQSGLHRKMFRDDRAAVEMFVGAGPLSSAHNQEFGNENSRPQPFLRPALASNVNGFFSTLAVEMWADLRKTTERAERKAARLAKKAGG
jgi:HK97 gp10 family phage protein